MTGYDFDKTIYKGDCSVDFFFYMLKTRPYLLIFTLWFLFAGALYGMKIIGKKRFKEFMFFYIPIYPNINRIVDKFWSKNANKIQDWYTKQKQADDVIITASPLFIAKPAIDMLLVKNYIGTNFNTKTGKIIGKNCYGEVKVDEFMRIYPNQKLDAFYSDSMSDEPMFRFAKRGFLVNGEEIKEINIR